MSLDTSALQHLRDKPPTKAKAKKPDWEPLDLLDLHPGTYLACDQSLAACGLVLFEVMPERDHWAIHMAQKIVGGRTEGWEETLQSSMRLQALIYAWVASWVHGTDWGTVRAVHEAPPTGGGRFLKPELSLVSAHAFRSATQGFPLLPMVRRQDHCKAICGNANAKKPVHHAALKRYLPLISGGDLITNEAHRDALSVALTAAKRGF